MDPILFQNLLYAVVTAAIGLIAFVARGLINIGIEYLKVKVGNEKFAALSMFAQTVVRFLEQSNVFEALDGSKKKELAIVAITKYAEEHNLPIDRELIDKIIEASVRIVKKEASGIGSIEAVQLDTVSSSLPG
jgi:hypothetical protein